MATPSYRRHIACGGRRNRGRKRLIISQSAGSVETPDQQNCREPFGKGIVLSCVRGSPNTTEGGPGVGRPPGDYHSVSHQDMRYGKNMDLSCFSQTTYMVTRAYQLT